MAVLGQGALDLTHPTPIISEPWCYKMGIFEIQGMHVTAVEPCTINIRTSRGIFHRFAHSCRFAQSAVHRGDADSSQVAAAHASSCPLRRSPALATGSAGALHLRTLICPGLSVAAGPRTEAFWEWGRGAAWECRGLAAYHSVTSDPCVLPLPPAPACAPSRF